MKKDYYKTLGISENANDEEIKKAYRTLSRKYHPDMNVNKTEEEKADAEEKFKEAAEAYAILSNPEERKKYDLENSQPFTKNMGTTKNWEDRFANYFGFDRRKNTQSTSNTSQQPKPKKIDFSEIIALENKIMEQKAILENMKEEISNYADKIKQEKEKIEEEIEELRKKKTSEEGFLKALQYIEKFRKKEAIPVINLTITEKQVNLYHQCVDIISAVEKQLDDLKKSKEENRIKPLKEEQEKKDQEYWDLFREHSRLERSYYDHPLRYKYEDFKRKQESSRTK